MPSILTKPIQFISGWANYPRIKAAVFEPIDRVEIREAVLAQNQIIARGNAKSYGDASLGATVLSTLKLKQIRSFEPENGIVDCEAGVLLSELLKVIIPAGWFFKVTPGIKAITIGGAIASDVHGKNHPNAGCFSNHLISFELMTASGVILTCSRTEHPKLFWQTCGGMGWTGIILSGKFSLLKISSTDILQKTVSVENLDRLFEAFEANTHTQYAAAWIDCTSKDWRGAVFFATHQENIGEQKEPLRFEETKKKNIPFFAPSWFLNPLSIRAHNYFYQRKNKTGERTVSLDHYFYPLDALQHWNRFYGRRGFVQYQFCLPAQHAKAGIRKALEIIRKSKEVPFLSVLKRHGARPAEAIHSFPIEGYSLALDFPRTKGIFDLVKQLDSLVWELGGKIYLTKDACSAPQMGRVDPSTFGEPKFSSLLKERITG